MSDQSAPKAKSPARIAAEAKGRLAYEAVWDAVPADQALDAEQAKAINDKAVAAARSAMTEYFLSVGYRECRVTSCDRLASPAFRLCPEHGAKA